MHRRFIEFANGYFPKGLFHPHSQEGGFSSSQLSYQQSKLSRRALRRNRHGMGNTGKD